MDDALSRLMPTQRIGYDGVPWWVGQVEGTASDEENNKGGYRYKVRIVGDHPSNREVLDTDKLPWATVMMPVNVPFMPGNIGGGHPQLIPGCWVTGFYIDNDRQKPIILGSIGVVPGATSTINDIDPNTGKNYLVETKNEGTKVTLKPGDMLVYKGEILEHWREVFLGSNCAQVFLHYNDIKSEGAEKNMFDGRPHLGLPSYFKGFKL